MFKLIKRICIFLITIAFLMLVATVVLFFMTQSDMEIKNFDYVTEINDDQLKEEAALFLGIGYETVAISGEKINKQISNSKDKINNTLKSELSNDNIDIEYLGSWLEFKENNIVLYVGFDSKVSFIKHRTILEAKVNIKNKNDQIEFDITKTKVGSVPMPLSIAKKVTSSFLETQIESISNSVDSIEIKSNLLISILTSELNDFIKSNVGNLPLNITNLKFKNELIGIEYSVDPEYDVVFNRTGDVFSYLSTQNEVIESITNAVKYDDNGTNYLEIFGIVSSKIEATKVADELSLSVNRAGIETSEKEIYLEEFKALNPSTQKAILAIYMNAFKSEFPITYENFKNL